MKSNRANAEWFKELWRYRELLYFLAWRDVKIRYKQAALGAAWAIIQPLFAMIVFAMFFGRLAGVSGEGIPYPIYCYCGLVPWMYFSSSLGQGGNSLVGNSTLITKVYFPRVLLPASSTVAGLLDFLVSASVLAVMMTYYHVQPGWSLLLVPLFMFSLVILTLGMSMLFGSVNVQYRDVKYVLPFLLQLWLFCTPIIYPATMIPERFRPLLALNPCWGIIEGFRACIFPNRPFNIGLIATSLAVTLAVFLLGVIYFRQTERRFADII